MELWTYSEKTKTHVTEVSDLGNRPGGPKPITCPACGERVSPLCYTKADYADSSREDIAGWHYLHHCGAKLLIIND